MSHVTTGSSLVAGFGIRIELKSRIILDYTAVHCLMMITNLISPFCLQALSLGPTWPPLRPTPLPPPTPGLRWLPLTPGRGRTPSLTRTRPRPPAASSRGTRGLGGSAPPITSPARQARVRPRPPRWSTRGRRNRLSGQEMLVTIVRSGNGCSRSFWWYEVR